MSKYIVRFHSICWSGYERSFWNVVIYRHLWLCCQFCNGFVQTIFHAGEKLVKYVCTQATHRQLMGYSNSQNALNNMAPTACSVIHELDSLALQRQYMKCVIKSTSMPWVGTLIFMSWDLHPWHVSALYGVQIVILINWKFSLRNKSSPLYYPWKFGLMHSFDIDTW